MTPNCTNVPTTGVPKVTGRKRTATGLVVLLLALLMAPNIIWLVYSHGWIPWVTGLLLPVALLTVLFALCGRRQWLACLLLAPFALLAPLECFYIATYQTPSTAEIIATLYTTNIQETIQYFGSTLPLAIAASLAALVLALTAASLCHRIELRWEGRARQLIGALAMAISIPLIALSVGSAIAKPRPPTIVSPDDAGNGLRFVGPGYPFGVIARVAHFASQWCTMRADAHALATFNFHAHRTEFQPHQRQVYVLVIGESSARDHWQIFGYNRPTNPELSQLPNLVPIRRMVTSWPETIAAVPVMLTRKPITSNQPGWKEPSFLPATQEAGYETWWISNQYPIGKTDSPVAMYAYEAQHVIWINHTATPNNPGAYDGALLRPLRKALSSSDRDMFIILHTMGSHDNYDQRYPMSFERFKPVWSDDHGNVVHARYMLNSYDNTIVYTDHILARIIGVLKQSGAITALWYESDHGEVLPLGTCRKAGHGIGTWHEYEIPALFWYSDAYDKAFPKRVATVRANAGKRTLSGDTFESLIDMAGVTFPGHNETRSLFSPDWRYRPRIVGQFWYTDFDHAVASGPCGILKPAPATSP